MTMETTYSKHNFNLYAINVLLGLQKGSRHLLPYSTEFKRFKFECFAIEREYKISALGGLKPELILNSDTLSNTLIFETSTAPLLRKITPRSGTSHSQISRYQAIEKPLLGSIALIPTRSLTTFDTIFIVTEKHFQEYENYFLTNNISFPLFVFDYLNNEGQYLLEKRSNSFATLEVNKFFSQPLKFQRIPAYLRIDIADITRSKNKFQELAGINLLQILHKRPKDAIFSAQEIASNVFNNTLWKLVSIENQKQATNLVNNLIEKILDNFPDISTRFFKKEGKMNYKIILADKLKEFELQKINRRILKFAKEETSPNIDTQLKFDY